jgi:amino acid permease
MNSIKKQAHIAGVLYVLASIAAVFAWIYVDGKIFVRDDATATANNIRASETLLRFGIAGELIGSIIFIFVVLALYRLFKPISEKHAMAMAILLFIFWLLIWGARTPAADAIRTSQAAATAAL